MFNLNGRFKSAWFEKLYRINKSDINSLLEEVDIKMIGANHNFLKLYYEHTKRIGTEDQIVIFSDPTSLLEKYDIVAIPESPTVQCTKEYCFFQYHTPIQEMNVVFASTNGSGRSLRKFFRLIQKDRHFFTSIFLYILNRFRASNALEQKANQQHFLLNRINSDLRSETTLADVLSKICENIECNYALFFIRDQASGNLLPVACNNSTILAQVETYEAYDHTSSDEWRADEQYKDIFLEDCNCSTNSNCSLFKEKGCTLLLPIEIGREMDQPRGLLHLYYKRKDPVSVSDKTFIRSISREIAAWLNEIDEIIERRIIESTLQSAEQLCKNSEKAGVETDLLNQLSHHISKHIIDAFDEIRRAGAIITEKNVKCAIGFNNERYGDNFTLTSNDLNLLTWRRDDSPNLILYVQTNSKTLAMVRTQVWEALYLLVRLLTMLIESEHNRISWMLRTIHEIRQPLQGLVAVSDVIKKMITEGAPRKIISYFAEDMETSIERLEVFLHIIDKMAGLDKITPVMKETRIEADVIRPIRRLLNGMAEIRGIKINETMDYSSIPSLNTDPELLSLIFYNLIQNAIKYGHDDSYINISCYANAYSFMIDVSNSGYEILESEKDVIFEEKVRGENAKRVESGLGLGLSFSRSLAELLNCKLTLISRGAQGKNIIFRLTIGREAAL